MLYNYLLDGTRVIADPAVNLAMNNINLNSLDDYNNYIKYLDSQSLPTPPELLDRPTMWMRPSPPRRWSRCARPILWRMSWPVMQIWFSKFYR